MVTKIENESLGLPQFQKKTESEIEEQRTLLRVLQKDKPRPWYYHRLPCELLIQIFKWITHPGDQVNLRRAFPGIGDLMKWDSVDLLYFKRIYPLVEDYLWPNWRHIWKLCQVSPEFMDVVLHQFEISLSYYPTVEGRHTAIECDFRALPDEVLAQADIKALVEECDALGRTEWMTNMPFLVVFYFYCYLDEPPEFLTKFLDAHGQKVWGLEITLLMWRDGELSAEAILNRLLNQTRNAVHLRVSFFDDEGNAIPNSFPDLTRLRSLCCMDPVSELLVSKYAAQLTSLFLQGLPPVLPHRTCLRNLRYFGSRLLDGIPVPPIFPDTVRESPLQNVCLLLGEDNEEGIPKLPAALYHLSHFGNTLENLTLEFCENSTRNWIVSGEHWKARVRLPKLSRLKLADYRGKLDWLVALPSVYTLTLQEYNRRAKADVGERSPDLIYVSTRRITRFRTNIWTQLPNLRQFKIKMIKSAAVEPVFWVTRAEDHEAYHKRSSLLKMAITIFAVLREIWAFITGSPGISETDLYILFAIYFFTLASIRFVYDFFWDV